MRRGISLPMGTRMDQLSVDPSERPHQNIISVYAVIDWILFPTPTSHIGADSLPAIISLFCIKRKKERTKTMLFESSYFKVDSFILSVANVTIDRTCDDRSPVSNYFVKILGLFFHRRYYLIVNKCCLFYDSLR